MARVLAVLLIWLMSFGGTVLAQQNAVPDHRYLYSRDVDFFGADLGKLFDTSQLACERACSAQPSCVAFTFNTRSNSCFPKTAVSDTQPYVGALSAERIATDPALIAQASERATGLAFLGEDRFVAAARLVTDTARRFAVDGRDGATLIAAAKLATTRGDTAAAVRWLSMALAVTDRADLWGQLAEIGMSGAKGVTSAERRRLGRAAVPAALNAYLRSESIGGQVSALQVLARALERNGEGRLSIEALRLAISLLPRPDLSEALDKAIAKYGFRITNHRIDNNSANPRICVEFSEPLAPAGVDYDPFVRVEGRGLVVQTQERQLCIDGVEHGARYDLTVRAGLPAASEDTLHKDVRLRLYVRDRAPLVRFPGRAFVLPRSVDAALPIETVNVDQLDLTLSQVSDRNLLRAIQQSYFGRPLSYWQDQKFRSEMAQEIWQGTAETQNTLNADMTTRLPLAEALEGKEPGIYTLTARLPGADPYDEPGATQWFVLTDLGLSTWKGVDGLTVAVRSLGDASPRDGIELTLISRANAVLGRSTTDASGMAQFAAGLTRGVGAAAPALLVARASETDIAFLPLTDPAFDLSDRGVEGRPPAPPIDTFLTTDRGAYRVGETIFATALMRDDQMRGVADVPLTAMLFRPDGVEYSRQLSTTGAAGGHVFALALGNEIPRGTWRVDLRSDLDAPALASQTLLVEDFMPERLDFALTVPETVRQGDTPVVGIAARYLFGAPAAQLPVNGEVRLRSVRTLARWPGYQFGSYDTRPQRRTAPLIAGQTDARGKVTLPVGLPDIETNGMPLEAEIIARVSEGSGRPTERDMTFPVETEQVLIGIRKGFDGPLTEGANATFDVVAVAPDGSPDPIPARWTVNKVQTRYQWYQLQGNWAWEPVTRRIRVDTGQIALGAAPQAVTVRPDWGRYELVIERADGPYAVSSVRFDAGWYGADDGKATPDRLEVSLGAEVYQPGDQALLRLVAPSDGIVMISVLSNKVIENRTIAVTAGETTVPLTVTPEWGTGAYVTATAIRPMNIAAGQMPARALGVAFAKIDPGDKKLDVTIDAVDQTDGQPGLLTAKIQIDGLASGDRGWVTLAAVDEGILNLTSFKAPDPMAHFFGQRRLGVELRDVYGRLINGLDGALGIVRSGGDAAGGLSQQSPPPTEKLMSYFSGMVETDAKGQVVIDIPRPAFNGTIRLMAVAWSGQGIGNATRDVIARDPVVVTASLPRFLAPRDQSRLLLEFVHAEGPTGEMPLQVISNGLTLGDVPASVTVTSGGTSRVTVPVTGELVGDHEITVVLKTPQHRLEKTLTLGVRDTDPKVAMTRRFTLDPGQVFTFDTQVLTGLRLGTAQATLSAGPLARFDMPGLLQRLDRYPYGCTEQVTSSAMPLLYLADVAQAAGLGEPERIQARVDAAIARILARQASNGAFGLWRAASGEFWLDAYVTDFLSRAKAQGYRVPDLAFSLAMDNLRNRINYAPDFDKGGQDIAYALMVLAREGGAAMGDLRYYADTKATAFATPLAAAQLGAALALYGDRLRADQMFRQAGALLSRQAGTSTAWRADFGTSLRDAAGVLKLAAEVGSDAVDQIALAAWLGRASGGFSTQEAAQIALAAHAMGQPGAPSGVQVNGEPVTGPVIRKLDQDSSTTEIKNTSGEPTDITVTTFGVPTVPPDEGGYGYAITRQILTLEGAPVDGPIQAGTRMVIVLRVSPFEKIGARLIVDDPLPAGFEIDNPNLLRSGDIKALDWLTPAPTENAEFRADRFIAAVNHRGAEPFELAYVVRAVTPGRYHHPAALVSDMYRSEYQARTQTGQVVVVP